MWMLWVGFAIATAVVTLTLVKAKVFLPLRIWLAGKNKFLYEMIQCTYCTSHWVGGFFAFIELYFVQQEISLTLFTYVLLWFLLTCTNIFFGATAMYIMYACHAKMGPVTTPAKLVEVPNGPAPTKRVRSFESSGE